MSTEPRGPEIKGKQQHSVDLPGRIANRIKRKRSLDEKTENKRDRTDQDTDLDLPQEDQETEGMDTTASKSVRSEVRAAIAEPDFLAMLSSAFAKQITEDLKKDINIVKEMGEETDKRVDDLAMRIDEYEQEKREKNITASGIPSDQTGKEEVRRLLNDKLKCNIAPTDIVYTLKLGKEENNETTSVKIAFSSKDKKKQIMGQKKN